MLTNHVPIGMSHLFRDPVYRRYPRGQQLTGVRVPALTRSTISNPGREQVSLEKSVPHHEVADVRQAAFRIQEDEVQLMLPHGFVVSFNDINGFRLLFSIQRIDLLQRISRRGEQANLPRRSTGFRHSISPAHLGTTECHRALLQVDILPGQGDGLGHPGAGPYHELNHQQFLRTVGVRFQDLFDFRPGERIRCFGIWQAHHQTLGRVMRHFHPGAIQPEHGARC